jgi:hypothetical protein
MLALRHVKQILYFYYRYLFQFIFHISTGDNYLNNINYISYTKTVRYLNSYISVVLFV